VQDESKKFSRADVLAKLAMAPLAIGAFAALSAESEAASKTAKSAVQYVTHPVGGKQCSTCRFYIAAKGKGNGQGQIVAGDIAPNAYCVAYAAKS